MNIPGFEFAELSEWIIHMGLPAGRQSSLSQKRVTSLKDFWKRMGKILRAARPDEPCWSCKALECYWRHGGYTRWLEEAGKICEVAVERFKCKFCGETVSVFPCFAVSHCRYTLPEMADGVEGYATTETTYKEELKRMGAVEQLTDKLPGPSLSQLWRWTDRLSERAELLLQEVQRLCVLRGVDDEELEKADSACCPNAWKARIPGKDTQLDALSKVVAQGNLLRGRGEGSSALEHLGMLFLRPVEGMQRFFAKQIRCMPTPHKRRPRTA